jgi:hypothetical protein
MAGSSSVDPVPGGGRDRLPLGDLEALAHESRASRLPEPPQRLRCGQVWGGRCRHWVQAPDWSHDQHPEPYQRLAQSRPDSGAAPWLLVVLAQDPDWRVRAQVARGWLCPPQLLVALAQDPDQRVRASVVQHPGCPPQVLEALSRDPDPTVRWRVAQHLGCPLQALVRLSQDPIPQVAHRALSNPRFPSRLARVLYGDLQMPQ